MLDVFKCVGLDSCSEEFAVKDCKEPTYCPFCGSMGIEFSHEVEEGGL